MTSIFVTHDLKEAILMGDKIGLMQSGELNIYDNLQAFINDPATEVRREMSFWEEISKEKQA